MSTYEQNPTCLHKSDFAVQSPLRVVIVRLFTNGLTTVPVTSMRATDELVMILISDAVGLKFIDMIIGDHFNDEGG